MCLHFFFFSVNIWNMSFWVKCLSGLHISSEINHLWNSNLKPNPVPDLNPSKGQWDPRTWEGWLSYPCCGCGCSWMWSGKSTWDRGASANNTCCYCTDETIIQYNNVHVQSDLAVLALESGVLLSVNRSDRLSPRIESRSWLVKNAACSRRFAVLLKWAMWWDIDRFSNDDALAAVVKQVQELFGFLTKNLKVALTQDKKSTMA